MSSETAANERVSNKIGQNGNKRNRDLNSKGKPNQVSWKKVGVAKLKIRDKSQKNLWWSIFSDTNSHCKTTLQIIRLFSVFILTCLQVLPQSEVMYISSLYSTNWDPRLPEEKIHTEYLHMNTERERDTLIFFFFNLEQTSNFLTLYDFKREGGVNVSELFSETARNLEAVGDQRLRTS